jgi:hypothetical protein
MRLLPTAVAAALCLIALAGCVAQRAGEGGPPAHPNPIVVHEFVVAPGVITLDPTLGYSLDRGSPGVPREERAEAIGRAASFNLADALSQELARAGYDVVRGDDGDDGSSTVQPGERALIVSGDFRRIYEGHRHAGAGVAVAVAIDSQSGGTAPQRLTAFNLDSQLLEREGLVLAAGQHGEDVNYEATRLGAAIGRYVAELARSESWPAIR